MRLLQFSTSHYCRKARLGLGFKQMTYTVENLTPGLHALKVKPLTGLTTLPVLLPETEGLPQAIADSTRILKFLETYCPEPALLPPEDSLQREIWSLEDWLDESIGVATRFVYYDFRAKAGKHLDPSLSSQVVIQIVRRQYGMTPARVQLAAERLDTALAFLEQRWQPGVWLVGDRFTVADLTAAALLSPLARIPNYRAQYPWLFEQIGRVHQLCGETLPPGLEPSDGAHDPLTA
ncbi:MAG TPA: glutathione S-transferase family protein [Synechococcales cyanobacterium M55_K2018_004]|nr:glutathione S-transferase family protein [Synechococcales cyanobacterium M55_K2018_004]